MEITKKQQMDLFRGLVEGVTRLIDENSDNTKVLERANKLALTAFSILSAYDGDSYSVGFSLQDYAYDSLQASKGDEGAKAWLDENRRVLNQAYRSKFSENLYEQEDSRQ